MTALAVLPMYDWPETADANDRLWAAIRDTLRAAGIAAPERLDRGPDPWGAWTSPDLVLGQTCGLPYMQRLQGRVALLGAPDYGIGGCSPGFYNSAIVIRAEDPRTSLASFEGSTAAVNELGSQSGYAALMHAAAPHARGGRFFGAALATGAHRASAQAVAQGKADLAAIDAVAWRLFRRHDPSAAALRVLMETEPTPALPLITARANDPAPIRVAVAAAIEALDPALREAFGLVGFISLDCLDYTPLLHRLARAEARHRLPTPFTSQNGICKTGP